jgi:protein-disulfide isomerase
MHLLIGAFAAAAFFFLNACSSAAQPAAVSPQTGSTVVATVGDVQITLVDVDERALRRESADFGGLTLAHAMHEARKATLAEMIGTMLIDREAARLGIDAAALTQREIASKVVAPTETDIQTWYDANEERVEHAPLDQVREPIRQLLVRERGAEARQRYLNTLRDNTPVTVTLDPPREQVADAGRPARGTADAPVQVVEFSDFQCPYCQRSLPTIERLLSSYGDRIRIVYRHFPLPNHPDAWPAAEASMCAAEQDKFWPYHDRLFANQDKLSVEGLKQHAADLGLDTKTFNACVDSRKYRDEVQKDVDAGKLLAITGTPAFFINGRLLGGAQPFPAFQELIEDELARRK